ncbi:hypothetical protein T484DRAFT_1791568, partial [Baffinella frigidus]
MQVNWTSLWDDSGEDDEDYDPKKDPLLLGHTDDDDGEDSDLEGVRHMLSPGMPVRLTLSGGAPAHTSICQMKFSKTPMASSTAELTLAPLSPNGESNTGDAGQNALTSSEYQRLLAVARGHAAPDEEDDDEDADFVPDSDADGEAAALNDDSPKQVSVSRCELSDLIADADTFRQGLVNARVTGHADAEANCPRSGDAASSSALASVQPAGQAGQTGGYSSKAGGGSAGKGSRRPRRKAADKGGESEVRVVVDQREGGGGFTSDQCIQLQGQMRDYLQLAAQQYVVCCCDE